ncbi:RDD family protein [Mycoplasma bradburyae]|uniref:RDD family protein n=1 Tax=Mycoplasma bradburyae TaxID=2963128 RepID=A0AAW6HNT4_9MOLU|nr:RDD family protein [Mycoplasma bradburyae]MDC4163661.1 RDD family protein [Mycoplasma bradburyae]MDC4182269.1 RDD family protein [Mycoplasma bradburyae]MDC4183435.1 RDD family protein [Mycoplasma bradburyae]MDC4184443.1 RDD family protein [Mycoplasma bradburyae]UTS70489.1 RDD family protein [Mycoplasma bradburyae]
MNVIFYNEDKKINEQYYLASATKRIFAALFDLIFISGISFGINYLINFLFDQYWTNYPIGLFVILVGITTFIFFSLYFILIPRLTKGKTLFRLVFKIQLIERNEIKKYVIHLFLHNILIYLFLVVIMIVMGASLFSFTNNQQKEIINLFLKKNILDQPVNIIIFVSFFKGLYSVYAILLLVILISVIMRSRKLALHDRVANLVMIDLSTKIDLYKQEEKKPKQSDKIEINLPGNIDISEI